MMNLEVAQNLRSSSLKILRTALQPDPLRGWSEIIADILQAEVVALTVFGPSRDVVAIGSVNSAKQKAASFIAEYQFSNPLRDFWNQAQCGESLRMEDAFRSQKMRRTPFYDAYSEDLDLGKGICMSMGFSRSKILISASRPKSRDIQDFDLTPLRLLLDDLNLGLEVSGAIWRSQIVVQNLLQNFSQNNIGAAILDGDGDTIDMNDVLQTILEEKGIFTLNAGRIELGPQVARCGFAEARRRAIQTGRSTKIFLKDDSGADVATVFLNPLPDMGSWGPTHPGKIILLCRRPEHEGAMAAEALTARFSLTPVECRVVQLLEAGQNSGLMAATLGVQPNTIRAHLKSIFAKTGTHSQIELLGFLKKQVV